MTEYNLQILRTEAPLPNKDAAIALLNAYEYHRIGQPLAVLYMDDDEVHVLYAVGKKDPSSVAEGEPKCGSDFYEIINRGEGSEPEQAEWEKLN